MTGKEFKRWAETIPDMATIEYKTGTYSIEWQELDRTKIRAVLMPTLTMDEVNNLEDVRS